MLQVVSDFRNVVQPGRTLRSGRRGRWFESSHSDHNKNHPLWVVFVMVWDNEFLELARRCFDYKRKADGSMPVSFSERAQRQLKLSCRVVQSFRPHWTARIF